MTVRDVYGLTGHITTSRLPDLSVLIRVGPSREGRCATRPPSSLSVTSVGFAGFKFKR